MNTEQMPVAVKSSPRSNHRFVTYVLHLATCLTGNASVPNPTPSAAALKKKADDHGQANADARGGGPGLVADRDAKRQDIELQIDQLVINVRATVRAQAVDAATAVAMILSTGLSVRKSKTGKKRPLAAKHGSVSGDVFLAVLAVAKTAIYFWEMSVDQKVWTAVPETMKASTTVSGLTPGQVYYFRFRARTRKGLGDYSDVVKLMVL